MQDLLGGSIDSVFDPITTNVATLKAGSLRALAVSSPKRLDALPDLPTVAESGYKDFEADQWYGVVAPAGTPGLLSREIAALDHVEDPGGLRDSIGAINVVFRGEKGALTGTNSDAGGFYTPIAGLDLVDESVIVIGAGGAARAVLFALAQADVGDVVILGRNPLKAAGLLAHFGLKGRVLPMDARLPDASLLVNASPLGMTGQEPLDLDLSPLPDNAIVYDLVYAPLETGLLKAAHARGLETVDGLEMLIGQAAIAFELFFGVAPPSDCDEELRAKLTI